MKNLSPKILVSVGGIGALLGMSLMMIKTQTGSSSESILMVLKYILIGGGGLIFVFGIIEKLFVRDSQLTDKTDSLYVIGWIGGIIFILFAVWALLSINSFG